MKKTAYMLLGFLVLTAGISGAPLVYANSLAALNPVATKTVMVNYWFGGGRFRLGNHFVETLMKIV